MKKISRIEYCAGFEPLQSGMEQDEGSRILLPTMKPLDADKKASKTFEAAPAAKVAERVDFSNVKIEPIFEEMVDFDTFAKRREYITYQDDMPLSQSIFQASKRFSKLPMISR